MEVGDTIYIFNRHLGHVTRKLVAFDNQTVYYRQITNDSEGREYHECSPEVWHQWEQRGISLRQLFRESSHLPWWNDEK